MLFHSSIRKEMARSFGATVVVLTTIVMTVFLIRTLGQATRGNVDPAEVMMVLGYTVLGHAPTILTLSLFISIVNSLSRMYRDSEMAIWFSSGRGVASFVGPLFRFAWPILAVIAALALFAWPWAQQQSQVLRERFEQRGDLERVSPGEFQESAGGSRVFFIDKDAIAGQAAGEVFIAATERGQQSVTSARAGRIQAQGDDRFLVLRNGQRFEKNVASGEIKLSEFEEYGVLVDEKARSLASAQLPRALSTQALLAGRTPALLGELSWRLGLALAACNLVLAGLVVSVVNPRVGRNGNMMFALFAFITYYNLVNYGTARIAAGASAFVPFMLALHGGILLVTLLLLAKLHWNWTFGALLRRRPATEAAA
jgi:lipopolysaccharide export system permease protein